MEDYLSLSSMRAGGQGATMTHSICWIEHWKLPHWSLERFRPPYSSFLEAAQYVYHIDAFSRIVFELSFQNPEAAAPPGWEDDC